MDLKLRQIPFFERWEVASAKQNWPKMCQSVVGTKKKNSQKTSLISGNQMETNEFFWNS